MQTSPLPQKKKMGRRESLLPIFFLREGDVCTQASHVAALVRCVLIGSLRGRRLKGKGKGGFGRERNARGAPLAFLSHLKLPFPSLSNACHAGYLIGGEYISLIKSCTTLLALNLKKYTTIVRTRVQQDNFE